MTENATRKPRFTRRGVMLGSAALGLVLAVAFVVFAVFDGNSAGSVRTTLMRFEKSADNSSYLAVFHLTNETAMDFLLFDADVSGTVLGRFRPQTGNGERLLGNMVLSGAGGPYALKPNSSRMANVSLPNDGRTGRVEVCLGTIVYPQTGLLGRLRFWWRANVSVRATMPRAICDQEIQCPLSLPDGTLQPPRLLSGPERKR